MTTQTKAVAKTEAQVEYIPLGGDADSKVKLSISIVRHYFASPTRSGKLPSDRDCIRFMLLCKSRALSPAEGDCWLIGYDGQSGPEFSLITAQQAFMKRAEVQPDFDGMESGVIVRDKDGILVERIGDFTLEDDTLLGGWATVHFKNRKYPSKERLNIEPFRKDNKFWKGNPAGLIVKCAESSALRRAFPTKLGGLFLRDEIDKVDATTLPGSGDLDLPPVAVDTGVTQTERLQEELETRGEPPKPSPAPNGKKSPTEELQAVIEGAGYNFTDFRAWCESSGNIPDASSLPDWDAIKASDAIRLLRAKVGLLNGIATMKGEGAH